MSDIFNYSGELSDYALQEKVISFLKQATALIAPIDNIDSIIEPNIFFNSVLFC